MPRRKKDGEEFPRTFECPKCGKRVDTIATWAKCLCRDKAVMKLIRGTKPVRTRAKA